MFFGQALLAKLVFVRASVIFSSKTVYRMGTKFRGVKIFAFLLKHLYY